MKKVCLVSRILLLKPLHILTASASFRNSFVFPIFHLLGSIPAALRMRRHPSARSATQLCLLPDAITPYLLFENKTVLISKAPSLFHRPLSPVFSVSALRMFLLCKCESKKVCHTLIFSSPQSLQFLRPQPHLSP